MTTSGQLETYLGNVTQRFDVHEAHAILMRFMCRCLLLVQRFLPEIGKDALNTATAFWLNGVGCAEDLLNARVGCWNYLDAKGHGADVQDQEDALMRAVICVLYAESESEDFSAETARWFVAMLDRFGDYEGEMTHLMKF